ncbi:hypothetical protein ACFE04_023096 [Oxalis oulophora]
MCFCGVGPIAISATKIVKRVYAIDLNPQAVDYIEMNSVLNKLESKIEIYNMDGRRFINAMLTSNKVKPITHVIINLPNDAAEFLDAFRGIFRSRPKDKGLTFPMIHVYGFSKEMRTSVMCFCGVGPIAISATKIVKRVYAIDLNPQAVDYIEMNSVLNKLESKIEIYNMDGRRFINAMLTSDKVEPITHVIINLPNDAAEFLDAFGGIFRSRPKDKGLTFPMIHVYCECFASRVYCDGCGYSCCRNKVETQAARQLALANGLCWVMCFCGVGPITISTTKIVKRVYAIDLNPQVVDYIEMNSVLNKLESKIEIYNMDGRRFTNAMLTSDKVEPITHVIINLPNDAAEFLDAFRGIFRSRPKDKGLTFPMIHVYGFSKEMRTSVMCFCGVGPIAISATKIVKRVYAIDLNPQAVDYIEMNSVLNKIESKIEIYNMDGRRFINAMLTSDKEVIKLFQTHHKFSKMARQTDLLKKIVFTRSDWCVHVRVVRMWEPLFGKQQFPSSLELDGTRMWCTVPQLMIKSVKMKVKENGVYVLQNFFVGLSTFHIRSCADVLNRNGVNKVDLIDVMGLLVTKHDIVPFSIEGKSHRRLTIVLQDLEKNTIECTLWDSYIDELFNGTRYNIVTVLPSKTFKGQMIITNTRHSETKMWINSNIFVINDFKKSLSGDDGDASSQLITTVSSTQSETLVDDLMSSPVRSIEELLTLEEEQSYGYVRLYVVETNVVDSIAPISVIIRDRECFQIYGKTTNEMRETKDGNVLSFPAELELICGRKFLFKIHKKSARNSSRELTYHVMNITDDKNLLTKFFISPSGGVFDEKPYVTAEETPCSNSQESVGDTISKDCTPAKRLFPTPAMDDDSHNASATKVPKITVKVENPSPFFLPLIKQPPPAQTRLLYSPPILTHHQSPPEAAVTPLLPSLCPPLKPTFLTF